ncbi:MAG: DNA-binding protein HU [Candidatus Wallbacteria bacterium GWC2_49_35]|uniref:DNA-binding protein HU n=1 Tax=Candidatus Wallbacteria bacterium GWC2_49_35 TaxID=1817813 RepID=A0A1F7WGW9_9BACT|nr:MAG: DNA-binding protein HU [Candidatus Wallbacteria bacterium GWC2_49_35]OQA76226.1 MAG: DNA-binding protein HU [bacterium ADurb.Bin243]HBC75851.1 DNA-binding protein HU [Candidatus Wallbacteria bacterium]HOD41133.1 HU family DNA-binding protein [Candidatus Wallbacteria bacterium]HOT75736.1 HU family DNA-binding protein [Candidatus Wallbacteria bacterium]
MNKADLIDAIAKDVSIAKSATANVIDSFIETVKRSLKKGEKVTLMGFGSWEVRERAARVGRNPQTGKEIKIKAKKVPKFNPGKELKEAVAK